MITYSGVIMEYLGAWKQKNCSTVLVGYSDNNCWCVGRCGGRNNESRGSVMVHTTANVVPFIVVLYTCNGRYGVSIVASVSVMAGV